MTLRVDSVDKRLTYCQKEGGVRKLKSLKLEKKTVCYTDKTEMQGNRKYL